MDNIIIKTKALKFMDAIKYEDVEIAKDKVNFIVGRSGSGKSTLLRLFNGTLEPSSGDIYYEGKNIDDIDTIELRQEVSLISQSVYLFDTDIRGNFKEFYKYRNMDSPSEETMKKYLEIAAIDFPLDKDCMTMSGGERQRVYIGIFLSFNPKVLMLDEPTSALDDENSEIVIKNVLDYCKDQGITVIVVSHDKQLTDKFADNIIQIGRENNNEWNSRR